MPFACNISRKRINELPADEASLLAAFKPATASLDSFGFLNVYGTADFASAITFSAAYSFLYHLMDGLPFDCTIDAYRDLSVGAPDPD